MERFINYSFDVSEIIIACHVPASNKGTSHRNRSSHGLAFRTKGEVVYSFSDGKTITVKPNDIIYLPKGSDYDAMAVSPGECYAINFNLFGTTDFPPFAVRIKNTYNMMELFKKSERMWRSRAPFYESKCKANLYNIIYNTCVEYESEYTPARKIELLMPGVEYINLHYCEENISIAHLAELCGISETYFRRIFHNAYMISPVKYINNMKLKRSEELLKSGMYSVSEAAGLSGFQNDSYFSREFKKAFGITPSDYISK